MDRRQTVFPLRERIIRGLMMFVILFGFLGCSPEASALSSKDGDVPREIRSGPMVLRPENEPKNHVPPNRPDGDVLGGLPGGPTDLLGERILKLAVPLFTDQATFTYIIRGDVVPPSSVLDPRVADAPGKGGSKSFEVRLSRTGPHDWSMHLESSWRCVDLVRQASQTSLILPKAGVIFSGRGPLASTTDSLDPQGWMARFVTPETSLFTVLAVLGPTTLEASIKNLLLPRLQPMATGTGQENLVSWRLPGGELLLTNATGETFLRVEVATGVRGIEDLKFFEIRLGNAPPSDNPAGISTSTIGEMGNRNLIDSLRVDPAFLISDVSREDLEKLVFRGMRRILSLKLPGAAVTAGFEAKTVPNGELRQVDGQPVALLWGKPAEIGTAHARLLGPAYRRTVDSTIYLVGLVETISNGKWFLRDLEDAWNRTSKFIPADHRAEIEAMAAALPEVSLREAQLANLFPEYFHCSGFSLFGKATKNGVMYHGRVLDYMTEIGLQQAAVNFVMRPEGKHAFLNVGFAGFIGSVSGMNDRQISVGEMGGGGRYQWDGAPMATLMRRALEECDRLDQVKQLWASSPRTCEYYYVFSDGKIPAAVALKATPQTLEFLDPGQAHKQLGDGIPDGVVLSAGNRLKNLRQRVSDNYGKIDEEAAIHLMDRPVAMRSNLHNVLFIPQKLEAFIAVASDQQPAADRPYAHLNLGELLKSMPK